ncbi:MAG: copper-binding protein [Acidobacteria bacterium]|nr:copper-binding protein [Acidobacteriota bacterium]
MRAQIAFCLALLVAACGGAPDRREFTLQGQVLSIEPAKKSVTVKHEEIKGLMPAMTMPYEVRDERILTGLAPGDLVNATLVVISNGAVRCRPSVR